MIDAGLQGPERAAVRETIDRILAQEEFRPAGRTLSDWIAERFERMARWLSELLGLGGAGSAKAVLVTFLVLGVVALAWVLARAIARRRETSPLAPAASAAPDARRLTVAALRREAQAAAGRGDHLAALRWLFRALVVGLSERGDLAYRDAWTNRELVERGSPRREVLPLLAPLVPRLDAQSFGREPAGPEDVARLAAICDRLLAGELRR